MAGRGRAVRVRESLTINLSACKYDVLREVAHSLGYEVLEDEVRSGTRRT